MRLARRVPWTSIAELEQICSWIFADENDRSSKILAINRLSAWKAITSIPQALEAALSILVVIVQDQQDSHHSSYLFFRQSYASAIIRLVNGLVDRLQLGAYARSIASIAYQLGLPQWLVELRHAATHEDLPSLELLRQAARESMAWLLHNYFIPAISPTSTTQPRVPPLRPLSPILRQYKNLLKLVTRDASLKEKHAHDIKAILRNVERWISEAKVSAKVTVGWADADLVSESQDLEEEDQKERWALDRLCDSLLENGVLVPLSKKKRIFPESSFMPPHFSVALWTPLIQHLTFFHPDLLNVLVLRICTFLHTVPSPDHVPTVTSAPSAPVTDPSFDSCLARWAFWCVQNWEQNNKDEPDVNEFRLDTISVLFRALGPNKYLNPGLGNTQEKDMKAVVALLQSLCKGNSHLERAFDLFSQLRQRRPWSSSASLAVRSPTSLPLPLEIERDYISDATQIWSSDDMKVMNDRLDALLSLTAPSNSPSPSQSSPSSPRLPTGISSNNTDDPFPIPDVDVNPAVHATENGTTLPPGWRLLTPLNSNWRPCPIGVHCRG